MAKAVDFSLIIPCYNEAENLPEFFPAATACLGSEPLACELVFVDDGSTDGTSRVIREQIDAYEERRRTCSPGHSALSFRVVEFSRNFGKEAAMFAGLEHATGDALGFIDADMQQDPAVALRMLNLLREDPSCDCVAAVQEHRRETLPLRAFKRLFYRMFRDMSNLDIVEGASDFRVFTRQVADALLSMREQFRFSKGMFSWVGFNTRSITYQVHDRFAGTSSWTFRSLVGYAWNGVVAFSTWPLRAVMFLGLALALVALVLLALDVFDTVAVNDGLSIGRVILYVVLLMSGIQMVVLGIFGEYLARAYIESKHRPLYIERRAYAVPAQPEARIGTSKEDACA